MPESKSRRTAKSKSLNGASSTAKKADQPNSTLFKVVMFGLMIIGLLWIITFYITSVTPGMTPLPIPQIGAWNIAVGFGVVIVGFLMTTRWRG